MCCQLALYQSIMYCCVIKHWIPVTYIQVLGSLTSNVGDVGWSWLGGSKLPTGPWPVYMSHPPCTEALFVAITEQEGPHSQARTSQTPAYEIDWHRIGQSRSPGQTQTQKVVKNILSMAAAEEEVNIFKWLLHIHRHVKSNRDNYTTGVKGRWFLDQVPDIFTSIHRW